MKHIIRIATIVLLLSSFNNVYGQYLMAQPASRPTPNAATSAPAFGIYESGRVSRPYGSGMSVAHHSSFRYGPGNARYGYYQDNYNIRGAGFSSANISEVGATSAPQLTTIGENMSSRVRRKTVGDGESSGGFGDEEGDEGEPNDREKPYKTPLGDLPWLFVAFMIWLYAKRKERILHDNIRIPPM